MSKVFSLAVLAAFIYLAYQQFPGEVRGAAQWGTDRILAAGGQFSSGGSERTGSRESVVPPDAAVSENVPPPTDVDVLAERVAVEANADEDPDPPERTADRSWLVEPIPSPRSDTPPRGQTPAMEPARPDDTRSIGRPTVRDRRDALAALTERMETIAIERAR